MFRKVKVKNYKQTVGNLRCDCSLCINKQIILQDIATTVAVKKYKTNKLTVNV